MIQNITVKILHGVNRKLKKGRQQSLLSKRAYLGKRFANTIYKITTTIGCRNRTTRSRQEAE